MSNKKDDWKEFLECDDKKTKKADNAFYRNTRSLENMGSELAHKLSGQELIQDETSDDASIEANLYQEKLDAALSTLTKKQKLAYEMSNFGNYTHAQIASAMGIARSSVTRLISRAEIKIREELDK